MERIRASLISVVVSSFLLGIKFYGYSLTGSRAIYSDAMESIVNVVAALAALGIIYFASQPADEEHPYGHGKAEYFSAAFEGGLLSFAGVLIFVEAIGELISGVELRSLNLGLLIVAGAGLCNLILGWFLKRTGTKTQSAALVASGEHILGDFWTSLGIVLGLFLVKLTGWTFVDPLMAVIVASHLVLTGGKILRDSFGGLMDAQDLETIKEIGAILDSEAFPGMIRIHATKVMRSGNYHHIDSHVVVPEFWTVTQAHDETDRFEQKIIQKYRANGEIHFHIDPCRRAYCASCDLKDCPVRKEDFKERVPFSIEELISPTELDYK